MLAEEVSDISSVDGALEPTYKFPNVINLNVGGKKFATRLSTLRKYPDSMLAVMFSGRHEVETDQDNNYFIDRSVFEPRLEKTCLRVSNQLYFHGKSHGKGLSRQNFDALNEVSKRFESCTTNAMFLEELKAHGISKKPKTKKPQKRPFLKRKSQPDFTVQADDVTQEPKINSLLEDHFIGSYKVPIEQLKAPPEEMLCRQSNQLWVDTIKRRLMDRPAPVTTVLPVMIEPNQVEAGSKHDSTKMATYTYFTLGGNHLRRAISEAIEECPQLKEILGQVPVHVYNNLNEEEGRQLGNAHNIMSKTLDFTWQDKVYQARKTDRSVTSISMMLSQMEMKKVPISSATTLASVAKYDRNTSDAVDRMFEAFSDIYGYEKSFPIQIFKTVQGLADTARLHYLRRAAEDIKSLPKIIKEVERLKIKRVLQNEFVKETDCEDFGDASRKFPNYTSQIDTFIDKASTKKITPEFMAFCKKAAEGQPPIKEDIEVQLKIKCGGKEIKDDEFLQGLKRKLIKDLKSNKRLRSILDQEDKEHHDIMIDEE